MVIFLRVNSSVKSEGLHLRKSKQIFHRDTMFSLEQTKYARTRHDFITIAEAFNSVLRTCRFQWLQAFVRRKNFA